MICKMDKEQKVREFLDVACKFVNENIKCEIKYRTHPEMRRPSPNRRQTQIQMFAEEVSKAQYKAHLPRQPPNARNNKIVMINDQESFPKRPGKTEEKKSPIKNQIYQKDLEKKLADIEERMKKKIEERIEKMKQRCSKLEIK